jgi:hypothetical protein
MVLRSLNRLILQSGGGVALIINSDNYITINCVITCAGITNSGSISSSTLTTTGGIDVGDKIVGRRYECVGVLFSYTTLTNSGGQSRDGYFIPIAINNYGNSIILCAFSHDSTQYTYWRGHISVGNSNNILMYLHLYQVLNYR